MSADIRDRLTTTLADCMRLTPGQVRGYADALLPVVRGLIADELDRLAREDSISTHKLDPIEVLTLRVVKVWDLSVRAAALRGQQP